MKFKKIRKFLKNKIIKKIFQKIKNLILFCLCFHQDINGGPTLISPIWSSCLSSYSSHIYIIIIYHYQTPWTNHGVSSIWFLLFEIKRVLVYNSTIFYLTDLFILYFFIQNAHADKKVSKTKG